MQSLILASCFLCGAINSLTPQPAEAEWAKPWWMPRHEEKLNVITNGGAKVVFLGDSITHFWETNGKKQLDRYFSEGDYKMLDLGFSGDRTEHVLWRITEGGELDGYEAKVVVVMIGSNNAGHRPFAEEPPIDTVLGIREILNTIRAKQPQAVIVLSPIFPRGKDASDPVRRRNETVNREIMKFADGKTIFWCDFNDQFLTSDGRLSPEIFPDLLHPADLGYEIWAAAVKPYIDYALSDGKLPVPMNRYASSVKSGVFRTDETAATFPVSRIRTEKFGKFDWWLDRMMEKRNQIAEAGGEIDLVFAGDSITHNWENQGKEALAELRKTYTILDIGYYADQTEHLLWRLKNGELEGYKAKGVMLLIGVNNTYFRDDPPEAIAAGVKEALATIAEKQPQAKILLLPIFPFGEGPDDPKRINNTKATEIIKTFADGEKIIWVDFAEKFLDEKGDNTKWMPDNAHPIAEGYTDVWLPAVRPYLQKIVGK